MFQVPGQEMLLPTPRAQNQQRHMAIAQRIPRSLSHHPSSYSFCLYEPYLSILSQHGKSMAQPGAAPCCSVRSATDLYASVISATRETVMTFVTRKTQDAIQD